MSADDTISGTSEVNLQEKISASARGVTTWAAARILVDRKAPLAVIGHFYDDYAAFCRNRKAAVLPRKTWLSVLKLAGFRTESGGLVGLRLK